MEESDLESVYLLKKMNRRVGKYASTEFQNLRWVFTLLSGISISYRNDENGG